MSSSIQRAIEKGRTRVSAIAPRVLPDNCSLTRPGPETRDAYGEVVSAPSLIIAANIPCGYNPITGREIALSGGVAGVGDYVMRLPPRTPVAVADALEVTARTDATTGAERARAHTFQVKAVLNSSAEMFLRVLVTEV